MVGDIGRHVQNLVLSNTEASVNLNKDKVGFPFMFGTLQNGGSIEVYWVTGFSTSKIVV